MIKFMSDAGGDEAGDDDGDSDDDDDGDEDCSYFLRSNSVQSVSSNSGRQGLAAPKRGRAGPRAPQADEHRGFRTLPFASEGHTAWLRRLSSAAVSRRQARQEGRGGHPMAARASAHARLVDAILLRKK